MKFLKYNIHFLALILLIGFTSCQSGANLKSDKAIEALPSNATMVTAFDLPTLMAKSNFEEVKKMEFYQFLMNEAKDESDILAAVFANPENTGIDLTKSAYLSIELSPDNPEQIFTGVVFNLASAEDFKTFSEGFSKRNSGKRASFQVADINDSSLMAWNDEIGVIAIGENVWDEKAVVNAFFESSTETSLSNNENLISLLSEKHDVTTWVTSNVIAKNKNAKLALSMAKIKPEALVDNFMHSYIDFEDGKITGKTNYFLKDELIGDLTAMFKDQVNTDFSEVVSGKNLTSFIALALDFDGLDKALSKNMQMKMFADFALGSYGLSIKKLAETFDGDLAAATYTGKINNRQEGLIVTKIKDLDKLTALLTIAEDKELLTKIGEGRYNLSSQMSKVFAGMPNLDMEGLQKSQLMFKGDLAIFSSSVEILDAIEGGTITSTQQLPTNVKSMFKQNPVALFMDLSSLKRMGVQGDNPFKTLEVSSSSKKSDLNFEMIEKEGNSLNTILKSANEEFKRKRTQRQSVSGGKS